MYHKGPSLLPGADERRSRVGACNYHISAIGSNRSSSAPVAANREVEGASREALKRGLYHRFTAEERAHVGQYAAEHGTAAAVRKFSSPERWSENEARYVVAKIKTAKISRSLVFHDFAK